MFLCNILQVLTAASKAMFFTGYITNSSPFPILLVQKRNKSTWNFWQGDEEARNILVERNLRLVAHIAKKYNTSNVDNDDLISIGTIGLIKAITSFDSTKGIRLATYAARCIDNEILMHLRATKSIKMKFHYKNQLAQIKKVMKYPYWISSVAKKI